MVSGGTAARRSSAIRCRITRANWASSTLCRLSWATRRCRSMAIAKAPRAQPAEPKTSKISRRVKPSARVPTLSWQDGRSRCELVSRDAHRLLTHLPVVRIIFADRWENRIPELAFSPLVDLRPTHLHRQLRCSFQNCRVVSMAAKNTRLFSGGCRGSSIDPGAPEPGPVGGKLPGRTSWRRRCPRGWPRGRRRCRRTAHCQTVRKFVRTQPARNLPSPTACLCRSSLR